jgi:ribosome maturation factor RimP
MVEELIAVFEPVLRSAGLELVDVEFRSGVLLVTVDRPGGVDLEALTEANRVVSAVLDERDPIPSRYSLEVSSPGVERPLRTPAHFTKALGETVAVKTRPQVPGERRRRGRLVSADQEGFELAPDESPETTIRLGYSDVDRVRTVFVWGPEPKPRSGSGGQRGSGEAKRTPRHTEKRKQVITP